MIPSQTATLLALIAGYDQRTVGESDVIAWHAALHDLDITTCRDAVITHYRNTDHRITPAQIRYLTRALRNNPAPARATDTAADPAQWRKRISTAAAHAVAINQRRRNLVLAHPDIAAKLTQPPLHLKDPRHWDGSIAQATYEGANGPIPNNSPIRSQLQAIVQEAAERARLENGENR
jgi:hypothetical protein